MGYINDSVINCFKKQLCVLECQPDKFSRVKAKCLKNEVIATLEGHKRADVVEMKMIETWLYEIAKNNIGIDDNLSNACKEIISRLDGLRSFSEERSK